MEAEEIRNRYEKVTAEIRACQGDSQQHRPVTLIAVSKTQPLEAIEELYKLGHRDFGENYVQELWEKDSILRKKGINDIRWHFIGHLQRNKVKKIIPIIHSVHSLDSVALAKELSQRWATSGRSGKLRVFVEVNVDDQPTKAGFLLGALMPAIEQIVALSHLSIEGLMCIPDPDRGDVGSAFKKMAELAVTLGDRTQGKLSMGMSSDFCQATRFGATHVRIGTAVFGVREAR